MQLWGATGKKSSIYSSGGRIWKVSCHLRQSSGSQSHVFKPQAGLGFHYFVLNGFPIVEFSAIQIITAVIKSIKLRLIAQTQQ